MSSTLAVVLEYSAVVLNIVFTILIGRGIRSGWLFGFVAAVIGVWLYVVQDAWLMAALNLFYAVMGLYGWWSWGSEGGTERIVRAVVPQHAMLLLVGLAGTWGLVQLMESLDQPGELLGMEAFIASFAMVATWMMSRKILENWFYWMVGDVVAVLYNHLIGYHGYALLNVIYIILAVVGFIRWRKQMVLATEQVQ